MVKDILAVGIGGAIGCVARFLVGYAVGGSRFPYATFIVNMAGCFLIGVFAGLADRQNWLPEVRLFLTVGLCGGFTTFSAFAIENVRLLQEKDYLTFAIYSTASFVIGLVATAIGLMITKQ